MYAERKGSVAALKQEIVELHTEQPGMMQDQEEQVKVEERGGVGTMKNKNKQSNRRRILIIDISFT